jgi:hypothetical protein
MSTLELSRRMLQAENLDLDVKDGILTIRISLHAEPRDSKSGSSEVIASSNGSLKLWDESGVREEILNLSLYKRKPFCERPFRPRRGRLTRAGR